MDITPLLERIRSFNVEALTCAIAGAGDVHVEPALCDGEGKLVPEGDWDLPMRVDFLVRGRESEPSEPVNPSRALSFDPVTYQAGQMEVEFHPFGWDWLPLFVDKEPDVVGPVLREWFLTWFDPEDKNEADEHGLYGVVHFLSDPEPSPGGAAVSIDLGSAPVACITSLFAHLDAAGVRFARAG